MPGIAGLLWLCTEDDDPDSMCFSCALAVVLTTNEWAMHAAISCSATDEQCEDSGNPRKPMLFGDAGEVWVRVRAARDRRFWLRKIHRLFQNTLGTRQLPI